MNKISCAFLALVLFLFLLSSCERNSTHIYDGSENSETETTVFEINKKGVSTDSYDLKIPKNYVVSQDGSSLKMENTKNGLIITVEEHLYNEDSYGEYIQSSINTYSQMGAITTEPEPISIDGHDFLRFQLSYTQMYAYGYFIDLTDKALMISVISLDESELLAEVSDEMISEIDLSIYI